jgi:hypothetical protein
MNLSTVRPQQGTELVQGPVSKGLGGEPFDRLRAGFDKLSPNGFVWRMLRFLANQDAVCRTRSSSLGRNNFSTTPHRSHTACDSAGKHGCAHRRRQSIEPRERDGACAQVAGLLTVACAGQRPPISSEALPCGLPGDAKRASNGVPTDAALAQLLNLRLENGTSAIDCGCCCPQRVEQLVVAHRFPAGGERGWYRLENLHGDGDTRVADVNPWACEQTTDFSGVLAAKRTLESAHHCTSRLSSVEDAPTAPICQEILDKGSMSEPVTARGAAAWPKPRSPARVVDSASCSADGLSFMPGVTFERSRCARADPPCSASKPMSRRHTGRWHLRDPSPPNRPTS